jgi:hypothetical protein
LRSGASTSCGCSTHQSRALANTKHGHAKLGQVSTEYQSWRDMRNRCTNPNTTGFPDYGGRGITVCERWSKFENFLADMGMKPSKQHSIERKDNNGNYTPDNCRWATLYDQLRNTSRSRMIDVNGRPMCITDAAIAFGINKETLRNRINKGWSVTDALTIAPSLSNRRSRT